MYVIFPIEELYGAGIIITSNNNNNNNNNKENVFSAASSSKVGSAYCNNCGVCKIRTHKRFKRTLFFFFFFFNMTMPNIRIFEVSSFFKLQNNT